MWIWVKLLSGLWLCIIRTTGGFLSVEGLSINETRNVKSEIFLYYRGNLCFRVLLVRTGGGRGYVNRFQYFIRSYDSCGIVGVFTS